MKSCSQCPELISYKIWLELFKFYHIDGDLTNMDLFLCDLNYIKEIVQNTQISQSEETYFFWERDKAYTKITDYPFDGCIKVTYYFNKRMFTVEQF